MHILETERLILRPLELSDAPIIQKFVSAKEVAAPTFSIPHPYPKDGAEDFIRWAQVQTGSDSNYNFAITRKDNGDLLGCISLMCNPQHEVAEIGYWIGVPHWGQGYATEAVRRMIQFAFKKISLNRIFGQYFTTNPASGRVMQKAGMVYEGTMRQHIIRWGEYKDVATYAILREEYNKKSAS